MKIVRIRAKDFMAFDEVDAKPGILTVVEGPNGAGKTSFLQAIVTALTGKAHDPSILRKGATTAEVLLDFDTGQAATLTTTADKTTVTATEADGSKIMGMTARAFLSSLVDPLTVNPLALLSAPPKQRLAWLIETVPVAVSAEEITEATGFRYKPTGEERNGFDLLQRLRLGFYNDRTGINGQLTAKQKTIEELSRALPEEDGEAPDVGALRKEKDARIEERHRAAATISRSRNEAVAAIDKREADRLAEFTEERDRKMAEARAEFETKKTEMQAKASAARVKANEQERTALASVAADFAPIYATLDQRIAVAEERGRQALRVADTRATIAKYAEEVDALKEQATYQTGAIVGIDRLKKKLIARVPIKGLTVSDGDIFIDGVAFDRLNEERRIGLALELAKLRAGELPVACVDGLEALDSAHFKAFERMAAESGMQFFVTRVSDDPGLSIHNSEAEQFSGSVGD